VYGLHSRRPETGSRRRLILAAALGLALLASGVVFATTSLAGTWGNRPRSYPWLEEARRIPNDQGPSPECSGTAAGDTQAAGGPWASPQAVRRRGWNPSFVRSNP